MNKTKVLYEEMIPNEFCERLAKAPIAYLPVGTLEWHGEHLPIGADGIQSQEFFKLLAEEVGGMVLPMLFLGPDAVETIGGKEFYGMDRGNFIKDEKQQYEPRQFAGSAYWVPDSTFAMIVEATLKQLQRAGFKIVVYHGHGPSTGLVAKHAEEWSEKYNLKLINCWGGEGDSEGKGIMVDHAAMNETSLTMALRPELVHIENLPKDPNEWPAGVGGKDPRIYANKKLGKEIISKQKERMVNILRDSLIELKK